MSLIISVFIVNKVFIYWFMFKFSNFNIRHGFLRIVFILNYIYTFSSFLKFRLFEFLCFSFILFLFFNFFNFFLYPLFWDCLFNSHGTIPNFFTIHLRNCFSHVLFVFKSDITNSYSLQCLFISYNSYTFNWTYWFEIFP